MHYIACTYPCIASCASALPAVPQHTCRIHPYTLATAQHPLCALHEAQMTCRDVVLLCAMLAGSGADQ
jgi:hypothetical protein